MTGPVFREPSLSERVDGLEKTVEQLLRGVPRRSGPIHWGILDADAFRQEWADVEEWFAWFAEAYAVYLKDRLPKCWRGHADMVAELAALRYWHQRAYATQDARELHDWHDHLAHVIERYEPHNPCGAHDPDISPTDELPAGVALLRSGLEKHSPVPEGEG